MRVARSAVLRTGEVLSCFRARWSSRWLVAVSAFASLLILQSSHAEAIEEASCLRLAEIADVCPAAGWSKTLRATDPDREIVLQKGSDESGEILIVTNAPPRKLFGSSVLGHARALLRNLVSDVCNKYGGNESCKTSLFMCRESMICIYYDVRIRDERSIYKNIGIISSKRLFSTSYSHYPKVNEATFDEDAERAKMMIRLLK